MAQVSDPQVALCALLLQYAMDMHVGNPGVLLPAPDPRLSPDWLFHGHIIGVDDVLSLKQTVCYGYLTELASTPGSFVAVIRGTDGVLEWLEDACFTLEPHPAAGRVESGFWQLYKRLSYVPLNGVPVPLVEGLVTAVVAGSLQIAGHSLGAPLATYLTLELALSLGARVAARLLASPHPGDAAFAAMCDRVISYRLYNASHDLVPHLAAGPDFATLARVVWITPQTSQAIIKQDLAAQHHALCYGARLDYAACDWSSVPALDKPYAACILGPNTSL